MGKLQKAIESHPTVQTMGETIRLEFAGRYQDDTPVVRAFCSDGGAWGTLTVCVPDTELADDELLVKTWTENEEWSRAVLEAGVFEDTGRRVPTGFVEAQVWRVRG